MVIGKAIKSFFSILPYRLQRLLAQPYAKKVLKKANERDERLMLQCENFYNEEEAFQKFKDLVNYAYEHVPYYKEAYDRVGVSPRDIQTRADVEKLPIIDKRIVKDNAERFFSDECDKTGLEPHSTGGSSGIRLKLWYDRSTVDGRRLGVLRWMHAAGLSYTDKGVWIGRPPESLIADPHRWRDDGKHFFGFYNPVSNRLQLTSNNMCSSVLKQYVRNLKRFSPDYIQGYASGVATLAAFMLKQGVRIPCKAVLTSSESLSDQQRKTIEEAFQCSVFDRYGCGEEIAAAFECAEHEGYHIETDRCFVEVLNERDESIEDEVGEIVGTNLLNYAFPLIRYKIGDRAALTHQPCACGAPSPRLVSLQGRNSEYLLNKNGSRITNATVTAVIEMPRQVLQYQLVQEKTDTFTIVAFCEEGVRPEAEIRTAFSAFAAQYLSISEPKIHIVFSQRALIAENGKAKVLICQVNESV